MVHQAEVDWQCEAGTWRPTSQLRIDEPLSQPLHWTALSTRLPQRNEALHQKSWATAPCMQGLAGINLPASAGSPRLRIQPSSTGPSPSSEGKHRRTLTQAQQKGSPLLGRKPLKQPERCERSQEGGTLISANARRAAHPMISAYQCSQAFGTSCQDNRLVNILASSRSARALSDRRRVIKAIQPHPQRLRCPTPRERRGRFPSKKAKGRLITLPHSTYDDRRPTGHYPPQESTPCPKTRQPGPPFA